FFTAAEDVPSGPNVVVLSNAFWKQQFGGDSSIIGKTVLMNGNQFDVIGVTQPGFGVYDGVDLWLPGRWGDAQRTTPGRMLRVIALLKPNVTVDQATAELK